MAAGTLAAHLRNARLAASLHPHHISASFPSPAPRPQCTPASSSSVPVAGLGSLELLSAAAPKLTDHKLTELQLKKGHAQLLLHELAASAAVPPTGPVGDQVARWLISRHVGPADASTYAACLASSVSRRSLLVGVALAFPERPGAHHPTPDLPFPSGSLFCARPDCRG